MQKWKKTVIKFGDTKIQKHELYQYKRPISKRKQIVIICLVVSNKVSFGKNGLNISLASKMLKKQTYMYISPSNKCIYK